MGDATRTMTQHITHSTGADNPANLEFDQRIDSASQHINAPPVLGAYRIVQTVAGGVHRASTGSDFRLEMVGTDQLFGIETEGTHSMLNAISVTGRRHLSFIDGLLDGAQIGAYHETDANDFNATSRAVSAAGLAAGGPDTPLLAGLLYRSVAFGNLTGPTENVFHRGGTDDYEDDAVADNSGVWLESAGVNASAAAKVSFAGRTGMLDTRLVLELSNAFVSRATSLFGVEPPVPERLSRSEVLIRTLGAAQWANMASTVRGIVFAPTASRTRLTDWNDRISGISHILHQLDANYKRGDGAIAGPTAHLVEEIVREAILALEELNRKQRQRTIGVALSGARPGQPFDICLTSAT
tara:strand:+ start:44 stop:1105 length:1062 start_codon:yes stop_codon:yes gene_type:complete